MEFIYRPNLSQLTLNNNCLIDNVNNTQNVLNIQYTTPPNSSPVLGTETYTNTLNLTNANLTNTLIFSYINIPTDAFYKFKIGIVIQGKINNFKYTFDTIKFYLGVKYLIEFDIINPTTIGIDEKYRQLMQEDDKSILFIFCERANEYINNIKGKLNVRKTNNKST